MAHSNSKDPRIPPSPSPPARPSRIGGLGVGIVLAGLSAVAAPSSDRAEPELRALFEALPFAQLVLDERRRIRRANRAAGRMFGVAGEEALLGQPLLELLGPASAAALEGAFAALGPTNSAAPPFEVEVRGPDGRPVPLELTLLLLAGAGAPARFGAVLRPVRAAAPVAPPRVTNYSLAELLLSDRLRELV